MKTKQLKFILILPVVLLLSGCSPQTVTAPEKTEFSFPEHDGYRIYIEDQTGWSPIRSKYTNKLTQI